jgi:CheY-like chemotaxis protein
MEKIHILWADDEIDLLKPHIIFLEQKGYSVDTATSGNEAIEKVDANNYDIIFLDENMPGLSGLETLERIKVNHAAIPVVMITKSEEEAIMESAIGGKISDYLIKPVNPNQILLSLKKNLDSKRLMNEKTSMNYQQEFRTLGMDLGNVNSVVEWKIMFRRLMYWELELEKISDQGLHGILQMQRTEANNLFSKFVSKNYFEWLNGKSNDVPVMSHTVFKKYVSPLIDKDPLFLIVIDNLRYDQWEILWPYLREFFNKEEEDLYFSILPTATQYARNSLFAGLLPSEIQKRYPDLWLNDDDEGGKNMHEKEFLEGQLKMLGKNVKSSYNKITNLNAGKKLVENFNNLLNNELNVIVYNFVDMLSHARTEMEVIRELADNEQAYRSITKSWFEHSPLFEIFKKIADKKGRVVITTDHDPFPAFAVLPLIKGKSKKVHTTKCLL